MLALYPSPMVRYPPREFSRRKLLLFLPVPSPRAGLEWPVSALLDWTSFCIGLPSSLPSCPCSAVCTPGTYSYEIPSESQPSFSSPVVSQRPSMNRSRVCLSSMSVGCLTWNKASGTLKVRSSRLEYTCNPASPDTNPDRAFPGKHKQKRNEPVCGVGMQPNWFNLVEDTQTRHHRPASLCISVGSGSPDPMPSPR